MAAVLDRYGTVPLSFGATFRIPRVKTERTAKKRRENEQKWARYGLRKRVRVADLFLMDRYGWEAVFSVLIVALLVSATMVTPMALADFRLLRIGRGGERALLAGQAQGAGAGAVSTDGQAAQ